MIMMRKKPPARAPTPKPKIDDEDTNPAMSTAAVTAVKVQYIHASLSHTNQGSSDDDKKTKG